MAEERFKTTLQHGRSEPISEAGGLGWRVVPYYVSRAEIGLNPEMPNTQSIRKSCSAM